MKLRWLKTTYWTKNKFAFWAGYTYRRRERVENLLQYQDEDGEWKNIPVVEVEKSWPKEMF